MATPTAATTAATRNTVCVACAVASTMRSCSTGASSRISCGLDCRRSGSTGPTSFAVKTAPKTATPIAPPSARKKFADAVAMPRSRCSTEFWIASTSTWLTIPKPRPKTAMKIDVVVREVPPSMVDMSTSPSVISASPATGKIL